LAPSGLVGGTSEAGGADPVRLPSPLEGRHGAYGVTRKRAFDGWLVCPDQRVSWHLKCCRFSGLGLWQTGKTISPQTFCHFANEGSMTNHNWQNLQMLARTLQDCFLQDCEHPNALRAHKRRLHAHWCMLGELVPGMALAFVHHATMVPCCLPHRRRLFKHPSPGSSSEPAVDKVQRNIQITCWPSGRWPAQSPLVRGAAGWVAGWVAG
jgi:hypothetical protein